MISFWSNGLISVSTKPDSMLFRKILQLFSHRAKIAICLAKGGWKIASLLFFSHLHSSSSLLSKNSNDAHKSDTFTPHEEPVKEFCWCFPKYSVSFFRLNICAKNNVFSPRNIHMQFIFERGSFSLSDEKASNMSRMGFDMCAIWGRFSHEKSLTLRFSAELEGSRQGLCACKQILLRS